jgi:hypothetical protein
VHVDGDAVGTPSLDGGAGGCGLRRHGDRPDLERREQTIDLCTKRRRRPRRSEDDVELELPAPEREVALDASALATSTWPHVRWREARRRRHSRETGLGTRIALAQHERDGATVTGG